PALMVTQPYFAARWEEPAGYAGFRGRVLDPVHRVVSHREGATTTVTVIEDVRQVVLKVDGKADASSVTDMPTQVLLAHVPILLAPGPSAGDGPREALVIGWGSGVSPGSAALHPGLRLTAVEIEPAVVEGARAFDHVNHRPGGRENVRVVFEDARTYLLGRSASYDVIFSEPSNPWLSGPAKLFTEDFFRIVRSRLREGGVFGQWVQMYGLAPDHLRAILRTFREVFPDVRVFVTIEDADLLLVGGSGTGPVDLARLAARAGAPGIREDLSRVSSAGWAGILSRYVGGPDEVSRYAGEGPRNTDDNGLVEFGAPWTLLREDLRKRLVDEVASIECDPLAVLGPDPPGGIAAATGVLARAAAARGDWGRARRFAQASLARGETADARLALAESFAAWGESLHATDEMERALALAPGLAEARERLAEWLLREGDATPALAVLEAAPEETPALRAYRGIALARAGRALEALEAFRGLPEGIFRKGGEGDDGRDGRNAIPEARLHRARARLASGDPGGAIEDYEGFLRDFPARMEVLGEIQDAYRDAGRWEDLKRVEDEVARHERFQTEVLPDVGRFPDSTEEGLRVRRLAFELHPQDAEMAAALVRALRQRGRTAEAIEAGRKAVAIHPGFLELAMAHAALLESDAGRDPSRAAAHLAEARDALRGLLARNGSLDALDRAEIAGRIARIEGKIGKGR
ncbi:MAG: fused MFS/spermidine synthase, partial [Planctomycetales bacterium]|nr:fused MFS/spermidine synthase [Planctomycetales bacterium]